MKKPGLPLILAACLATVAAFAQNIAPMCPSPPPPGASFCQGTCVYCLFDGYTGTTNYGPPTNDEFCGIAVQNPTWMAFVANSAFMEISITPSNCVQGNGLQMAIFDNCGGNLIGCDPGKSGGGEKELSLALDYYIPGKTYYLLIDGFASDVCDFRINVNAGSLTPPAPDLPGPITGPSQACPNTTITYSIPPVFGAGYYHWIAPAGATINGGSNNQYIDAPYGNSVTVNFSNPSGAVSVSVGNSCFAEGSKSTKMVTVIASPPIPLTTMAPVTLDFADLPYNWPISPLFDITSPGTYHFSSILISATGCDSTVEQTITALPPNPGYATGKIYWDTNNNGIKDSNEPLYKKGAVISASSGVFTNSDAKGEYIFQNLNVGDTLRLNAPVQGVTVTPAFRLVQATVWNGYDFGLVPGQNSYDLKVSISNTVVRPGFKSWLTIVCQNVGYAKADAVVLDVELPAALQYLSATLAPDAILGNKLTWQLGTLQVGDIRTITVETKTPLGTPLGFLGNFVASITPDIFDIMPQNNSQTWAAQVVSSYDPNDKQVRPAYVTPGMLSNGSPFEYNIRFQNTGNFSAEFITIVDSLGDKVDPATFKLLASSHRCTWKISGSGVVEFRFDNIYLPDSTSNEAASHGFVQFSVEPKKNLPLGTVIHNFCDIYFDFNPPVRTNTAGTQVVYFLPGEGLTVHPELLIRPNPATLFALFNWKVQAPADGRIRLFDVTGLPRLDMPVTAGQSYIQANVSSLPSGLYYVVLESGSLMLTNKLVVVTLTPLGQN